MNRQGKAVIQQINTKQKTIKVFCSTNGIVNRSLIRERWSKGLPGYKVLFIDVTKGKRL